jgi:protein-tyrosine phosphatase
MGQPTLVITTEVQAAAEYWRASGKDVPEGVNKKFYSMATFCRTHGVSAIPDPYYGGEQGFDNVLDLLDDACMGLLEKINQGNAP